MSETRTNIGTSLVNIIKFVKKRRGVNGVEEVFARLKEEAHNLWVDPSSAKEKEWYQLDTVLDVLRIYEDLYGGPDLKQTFNIGVHNAKNLGVLGAVREWGGIS